MNNINNRFKNLEKYKHKIKKSLGTYSYCNNCKVYEV